MNSVKIPLNSAIFDQWFSNGLYGAFVYFRREGSLYRAVLTEARTVGNNLAITLDRTERAEGDWIHGRNWLPAPDLTPVRFSANWQADAIEMRLDETGKHPSNFIAILNLRTREFAFPFSTDEPIF